MTLAEEAPDYAERIAAYLKKSGGRRLPWGAIVAHGALTYRTTAADRAHRAELGETAIALLGALGVSASQLDAIDASYGAAPPAPAELLAALQASQETLAPVSPSAEPPPLELRR